MNGAYLQIPTYTAISGNPPREYVEKVTNYVSSPEHMEHMADFFSNGYFEQEFEIACKEKDVEYCIEKVKKMKPSFRFTLNPPAKKVQGTLQDRIRCYEKLVNDGIFK